MFFKNVLLHNYPIIAITESWIRNGVFSNELFPENYVVYRKDRSFGEVGGGVLLAVSDHIQSEQHEIICPIGNIDLVYVKLSYPNQQPLFIFLTYIPPNLNYNELDVFLEFIEDQVDIEQTVLLGDFNLPDLQKYYTNNTLTRLTSRFIRFLSFCDFVQHNKILNSNNKLLDLVISPECLHFEVTQDDDPLVPVDLHHPSLLVELPMSRGKNTNFSSNCSRLNFRKANYNRLYQLLSEIDWRDLMKYKDANQACEFFNDTIQNVLTQCVPLKKTKSFKYPC